MVDAQALSASARQPMTAATRRPASSPAAPLAAQTRCSLRARPTRRRDCATARGKSSSTRVTNFVLPACAVAGTRERGEPCAYDSQCASLACSRSGQACGVCALAATPGEASAEESKRRDATIGAAGDLAPEGLPGTVPGTCPARARVSALRAAYRSKSHFAVAMFVAPSTGQIQALERTVEIG